MGKNDTLIIGGIVTLVIGGFLYMTQKCGLLYPIFKADCNAGEAKAAGRRPADITDEYIKNNYPPNRNWGGSNYANSMFAIGSNRLSI